jgi:glyoxylase-like metal-dependent hydrolase (beta-lactamase superfamily II)
MRVKRWLWALGILVGVGLISKRLWLDTAAEPGTPYAIDLEALHRTATEMGPLPTSIEVEKVAEFGFPRTLAVAGDGFKTQPMVLLAHRVMWPDKSVIIDTAMGPEAAKKMPGSSVDGAAFARLEAAMTRASAIVVTHEHSDHVGGLAAAPNLAAIANHVHLTREQLSGPKLERDEFPKGALEQLKPLDYQGLYALAPGIVLQKAPGHSVGSQLVYVELANGERFLFIGDIAWTYDNIRLQRGRPGLATLLMKEDRPAVAAQIAALGKLPHDVHIVVAHDPVALAKDLQAGLFHNGFSGL